MNPDGYHILIDYSGCDERVLNDAATLAVALADRAKNAGATVLDIYFHQFDPQGCTVLIALAESHISLHTFPEEGYAALDVFTCGKINPMFIVADFATVLDAKFTCTDRLLRGVKYSGYPCFASTYLGTKIEEIRD